MEVFPGIDVDPGVRFGKPCVAGTRIWVVEVLGELAAGETYTTVETEYRLTRQQILAAIGYASQVIARKRI